MKTQHTPGPWKAQRDCRGARNHGALPLGELKYAVYDSRTTLFVASDFRDLLNSCPTLDLPGDDEMEANAHLIAAAPELLAALVEMTAVAALYSSDAREGSIREFQMQRARAAIAKATGKDQA